MSRRLSMVGLRRVILRQLGDEWVTPYELSDRLGVGHGDGYLKVALVLERLANDGEIELRPIGNRRRFRRAGA